MACWYAAGAVALSAAVAVSLGVTLTVAGVSAARRVVDGLRER